MAHWELRAPFGSSFWMDPYVGLPFGSSFWMDPYVGLSLGAPSGCNYQWNELDGPSGRPTFCICRGMQRRRRPVRQQAVWIHSSDLESRDQKRFSQARNRQISIFTLKKCVFLYQKNMFFVQNSAFTSTLLLVEKKCDSTNNFFFQNWPTIMVDPYKKFEKIFTVGFRARARCVFLVPKFAQNGASNLFHP